MDMEDREHVAESAAGQDLPQRADHDAWLDRALEDTFPASDPVAANRFD
jgi:hypothetical protein